MDFVKSITSAGEATTEALIKHSPAALSVVGIGAFFVSIVWAVKETPNATIDIKEAEEEKGEPLTGVEKAKACGKRYIPSAIMFGLGGLCIVESNRQYNKKIVALTTAASLSETALREYKEQTEALVGKKKEKYIREQVADKQIKDNPPSNEQIMLVGAGDYLCYDPISKQYFVSTSTKIEKAINRINSQLLHNHDNGISVNDYLYELGLRCEEEYENLGWRMDSDRDLLDLSWGHKLSPNDIPALVIMVDRPPVEGYWKG